MALARIPRFQNASATAPLRLPELIFRFARCCLLTRPAVFYAVARDLKSSFSSLPIEPKAT